MRSALGGALAQRATPFVTARQWSEGSVGTVWSRRSTPSASNFQSRKTHSESEPVLGHIVETVSEEKRRVTRNTSNAHF